MKKIIYTLLLIPFLLLGQVQSQKNVVKFNLGGLLNSKIGFGYERVTFGNQSVSLLFNARIPVSLPNYFVEDVPEVGTAGIRSRMYGFSGQFDYRFYFGKGPLRGFYIGPYLSGRYNGISTAVQLDTIFASVEGSFNSIGGGLTMGVHWVFAKHFSVDFNFLGLGVVRHSLNLKAGTNIVDPDLEQLAIEVDDIMSQVPFFRRHFEINAENDFIEVRAPIIFPAFRSILTLGFAF